MELFDMSAIKLKRYDEKPILEAVSDHSWEARGAFNAGAVCHDGKVYILYTAAAEALKNNGTSARQSRIGLAISENGMDISYRHPEPVIDWDSDDEERCGIFGINGVENPRISRIGDTYHIVYTITSDCDDRIALATTKDFRTFTKHGLIADDMTQRCGALFPEMIDGKYWLAHRPLPTLWVSSGADFNSFSNPRLLLRTKLDTWREKEVGIAVPPIKTENAWAVVFFGKDRNNVSRLGLMWLDLNDPGKVLKVQDEPILEPETEFEIHSGGVYSCGAVQLGGES
jgi:predicted GH43/DUF377 family glycosyl hydrolase